MQEEQYGGQLALSSGVREHLDGLLLQTIVRIREDLARMALPVREVFHRASPRSQAFALTASIREAIRRYWRVFLTDTARTSIEAEEVAMWAYIDEILAPVRRGTTPVAALEQLWLTLTERALELGYQVEPTKDPDELTRCMRRIVEREAWKHKNRLEKCRNDRHQHGALDEGFRKVARHAVAGSGKHESVSRTRSDTLQLDEGTVGGQEVPADPRGAPIRARMEVVSENDCERAYIAFLATGFQQSEAARRAGLTPGEARAFRDRADPDNKTWSSGAGESTGFPVRRSARQ